MQCQRHKYTQSIGSKSQHYYLSSSMSNWPLKHQLTTQCFLLAELDNTISWCVIFWFAWAGQEWWGIILLAFTFWELVAFWVWSTMWFIAAVSPKLTVPSNVWCILAVECAPETAITACWMVSQREMHGEMYEEFVCERFSGTYFMSYTGSKMPLWGLF